TDSRLDYAFRGSINDNTDVDFYRVTAPVAAPGASEVLTVSVWGLPSLFASSAAAPRVLVYDAQQHFLTAQVLVNDGFTYSVQVANAVPGAAYYVEVMAWMANGQANLGNYFLGVDFAAQAAQLANVTTGTFGNAGQSVQGRLTSNTSQLFHFVLSASGPAGVSVRMTIYDASGAAVFTLTAGSEPVSGNVILK